MGKEGGEREEVRDGEICLRIQEGMKGIRG